MPKACQGQSCGCPVHGIAEVLAEYLVSWLVLVRYEVVYQAYTSGSGFPGHTGDSTQRRAHKRHPESKDDYVRLHLAQFSSGAYPVERIAGIEHPAYIQPLRGGTVRILGLAGEQERRVLERESNQLDLAAARGELGCKPFAESGYSAPVGVCGAYYNYFLRTAFHIPNAAARAIARYISIMHITASVLPLRTLSGSKVKLMVCSPAGTFIALSR